MTNKEIMNFSQLKYIVNEIDWLKGLSFASIDDACQFIKNKGGNAYNIDDDEGFFDFDLDCYSATFFKDEMGYYCIGGTLSLYTDDCQLVADIDLES